MITEQSKKVVLQEGLVEYKDGKFQKVNWKKAAKYCQQPYSVGSFVDDVVKTFWKILWEERLVSVIVNEHYSLMNSGSRAFVGPRDPISQACLYFTNIDDARAYKQTFLQKESYFHPRAITIEFVLVYI